MPHNSDHLEHLHDLVEETTTASKHTSVTAWDDLLRLASGEMPYGEFEVMVARDVERAVHDSPDAEDTSAASAEAA